MKSFWLFRSNLRQLESYHQFLDLEEFKLKCHDFYLLMSLYFLENSDFDEVIIWRLQPKQRAHDIVFNVNGKWFIQKFVDSFKECYKYNKPEISFFRGGFPEYCEVTKENPNHFGLKLYLGAGRRVTPQYGGKYDLVLVESEKDKLRGFIPFYKTTNDKIFFPNGSQKENDICFISNFEQIRYKGQEFFIKEVSRSKFLKGLKVAHIGNQPNVGYELSKKYNLYNITYYGSKSRPEINNILNKSKFGLVCSDCNDGCPRVITEILMSGTPLIIRDKTRLLQFYKEKGVSIFNDNVFEKVVDESFKLYQMLKQEAMENIKNISMDKICEKNLSLWRG